MHFRVDNSYMISILSACLCVSDCVSVWWCLSFLFLATVSRLHSARTPHSIEFGRLLKQIFGQSKCEMSKSQRVRVREKTRQSRSGEREKETKNCRRVRHVLILLVFLFLVFFFSFEFKFEFIQFRRGSRASVRHSATSSSPSSPSLVHCFRNKISVESPLF